MGSVEARACEFVSCVFAESVGCMLMYCAGYVLLYCAWVVLADCVRVRVCMCMYVSARASVRACALAFPLACVRLLEKREYAFAQAREAAAGHERQQRREGLPLDHQSQAHLDLHT
eukprot:3288389-Pleurochrysis_carterae.AAC.1